METLLADCETDGLLPEMTRLWMLQLGTPDGDDVDIYADQPGYRPIAEGLARLNRADRVVFHNGLGFDLWAINKVAPGTLRFEQIFDTLVAARLFDPESKSHELATWGKRLGIEKGEHTDWSQFSEEMVEYGKQDIRVLRAMYRHLLPVVSTWGQSLQLEHKTAYVIAHQEQNGFCLNIKKAALLEADLRQQVTDIERELQAIFPPIFVSDGVKNYKTVPKLWRGVAEKGVPFTSIKLQQFNPGSRQQIADRLKRKYGWKPKLYTDKGSPQIDEAVLGGLRFPECKALLRYLAVEKQLGQLSDGKNGWLKLVGQDGRVHGRVNTNGAVTGRMSHFTPNMAQVSKKDLRMREVWEPRPGWKLVGCDAEGLEARMLGHYLARYDNGAFSNRVVNGKKEDKTDVHSENLKVWAPLGMASRDGSKTELYALIYGAQDPKLGEGVQEDRRNQKPPLPPIKRPLADIGADVRRALAKAIVGIDRLTDAVKFKAKSTAVKHSDWKKNKPGYVIGLDGRRLFIRSQHSSLNTLLQGGGAIVMKLALVIFFFERCVEKGWVHGVDYAFCANVHDEVQIECRPEIAEEVGKTFAECITEAGVRLKLRCPLAGDYAVGNNWKETH